MVESHLKVDTSELAKPVVPILEKDESVRLCGDYSITVNPQLMMNEYPLPTIDELFADMAGFKVFGKIDLQLEVDEESAKILTLNTHRSLLKPTRLLFGIAYAPAIRQQLMELCSLVYGELKSF